MHEYIFIIIIIIPCEFFTWVWVTASLLRSRQCCSLDGLNFSYNFQAFGDHSESAYYSWYHCHPYVLQLSQFSGKIQVLVSLITFFDFHSVVCWDAKVLYTANSLFILLVITIFFTLFYPTYYYFYSVIISVSIPLIISILLSFLLAFLLSYLLLSFLLAFLLSYLFCYHFC